MIPPREYILLKDVPNYTLDHLLAAIIDGHLDAYVEYPGACSHVDRNYKGKLLRYSRLIGPINKDDKNCVLFPKIEILANDGSTVLERSFPYSVQIKELRIKAKDLLIEKNIKNIIEELRSKNINKTESLVLELVSTGRFTLLEIGQGLDLGKSGTKNEMAALKAKVFRLKEKALAKKLVTPLR